MMGESVSESPSPYWVNKEYLLEVIMRQIGITNEDLHKDPSWVKAKVRDIKIDKVLED